MSTINLRDFYPWCDEDTLVEVSEEILEAMKAADRQQEAYRRHTYRYKAQYSLDCNDGIENLALIREPSLEEILIKKTQDAELQVAISKLAEKGCRRLMAHFFEGMNYRQIAKQEGVAHDCIGQSISAALKKLKGFKK